MIKHAYEANHRNPYYLKFLSAICSLNQKGVSVNQEILYKIFTNKELIDIKKAAFIDIKM